MSNYNKVMWNEGLFLLPQHFQQQERFFEQVQAAKFSLYFPHYWGIADSVIDIDSLKQGHFCIEKIEGCFSDGSLVRAPQIDNLPNPIQIEKSIENEIIYLCVPKLKSTERNVGDDAGNAKYRYICSDHEVTDITSEEKQSEIIQVKKLNVCLMIESQDRTGFLSVPIAKIKHTKANGEIVLDDRYIATRTNILKSTRLKKFLVYTVGLLKKRIEIISHKVSDHTNSSISNIMILQILNRNLPMFEHLLNSEIIHPEKLYLYSIQLVGELSTFTNNERKAPDFKGYKHDDLTQVFDEIASHIDQCFSVVIEQSVEALTLEQTKYGIFVAKVKDKTLLRKAQFIIAVTADVPTHILQNKLLGMIKIGPVEHIRDIVNNQVAGIQLTSLLAPPRQTPYLAGYQYFELVKGGHYWNEFEKSGGIAIHLSGTYPGLKIEMWSIKS